MINFRFLRYDRYRSSKFHSFSFYEPKNLTAKVTKVYAKASKSLYLCFDIFYVFCVFVRTLQLFTPIKEIILYMNVPALGHLQFRMDLFHLHWQIMAVRRPYPEYIFQAL